MKINLKKFISRQCRTAGDTYLIRQLKMPTLAYHILLSIGMGKQRKRNSMKPTIQVTEIFKFFKAINTCQNHQEIIENLQ